MAQSSANNIQLNNVKKIHRSIDFIHSFRPFYYFARIFGYLPFTILYDSNDSIYRPTITVFDSLWFIISICLQIFVVILSVPISQISHTTSLILNDSGRLMLIVSLAFGVVIIAMDMYHRFKFVHIFNEFNKIDDEVGLVYI